MTVLEAELYNGSKIEVLDKQKIKSIIPVPKLIEKPKPPKNDETKALEPICTSTEDSKT